MHCIWRNQDGCGLTITVKLNIGGGVATQANRAQQQSHDCGPMVSGCIVWD
jgi:hypothetical protein